jgi:hypothetical protein
MSARATAQQAAAIAVLRRYLDPARGPREIVVHRTPAGDALVIDRARANGFDARLVAHLAADEPSGNAALACDQFLAEPADRRACRRLTVKDLIDAETSRRGGGEGTRGHSQEATLARAVEKDGESYDVRAIECGMSIPALRWLREPRNGTHAQVLSLREVVARLEAYEPACAMTRRALAGHAGSRAISTALLRAELERLLRSPIVLNRGIREAVTAAVARGEASMSEIAIRCGRQKRDHRGNISGETSWLSRRLGLLPEGGQRQPTPWIHSDVLALIARCGLGMSPREVEL